MKSRMYYLTWIVFWIGFFSFVAYVRYLESRGR